MESKINATDSKLNKLRFLPANKRIIGNFELNETTRSLYFARDAYYLRAKLYSLFYLLMISKESLLTREFIIETVWQGNRAIGNKSLTRAIYDLRKILQSDPATSVEIITVPKIGFYLQTNNRKKTLREVSSNK